MSAVVVELGNELLDRCSFIPCANFATAFYVAEQLRKGGSVEDETETDVSKFMGNTWFVALLN